MTSIPTITKHRAKYTKGRVWIAAAGAVAVAATVAAVVSPSTHHTSNTALRTTADRAAAGRASGKSSGQNTTAVASAVDIATAPKFTVWGKTHLALPSIGSSSVSVVGVGSLGAKGGENVMSTASVAKTMTAYLILKDHPLKNGSNGPIIHVTAAEAAALPHERATAQSTIPVRAGEALTERQALNALMLASANNVARILARWDAGSIPAFLAKMNSTAKGLGMSRTHYTDPSGWDKHTLSTVNDQIRLADVALRVPGFEATTSTKTAYVPIKGQIRNYNALLGDAGVVGIKTGSMSAAGGCLLFAAHTYVGGKKMTVIGSVFGQRSSSIGDLHQAFASSRQLLASAKSSLGWHTILHKGQVVATVPGTGDKLVASGDLKIVAAGGMHLKGAVKAHVPVAAKNGAKVGTVTVAGTTIPLTVTHV